MIVKFVMMLLALIFVASAANLPVARADGEIAGRCFILDSKGVACLPDQWDSPLLKPLLALTQGSFITKLSGSETWGYQRYCALPTSGRVSCSEPEARKKRGLQKGKWEFIKDVGRPIVDVGMGGSSCLLTDRGDTYCWGPRHGASPVINPTLVNQPEPFTRISVGDANVCAIGISGKGYCWNFHAAEDPKEVVIPGFNRERLRQLEVTKDCWFAKDEICAVSESGRAACKNVDWFWISDGSLNVAEIQRSRTMILVLSQNRDLYLINSYSPNSSLSHLDIGEPIAGFASTGDRAFISGKSGQIYFIGHGFSKQECKEPELTFPCDTYWNPMFTPYFTKSARGWNTN